jgi:hypothetical protein
LNCFIFRAYNKSGHAILDHLGNRAGAERNHRSTTGHRFDHDETEWLGPIDGKKQRGRITEKSFFGGVIDLAGTSL